MLADALAKRMIGDDRDAVAEVVRVPLKLASFAVNRRTQSGRVAGRSNVSPLIRRHCWRSRSTRRTRGDVSTISAASRPVSTPRLLCLGPTPYLVDTGDLGSITMRGSCSRATGFRCLTSLRCPAARLRRTSRQSRRSESSDELDTTTPDVHATSPSTSPQHFATFTIEPPDRRCAIRR